MASGQINKVRTVGERRFGIVTFYYAVNSWYDVAEPTTEATNLAAVVPLGRGEKLEMRRKDETERDRGRGEKIRPMGFVSTKRARFKYIYPRMSGFELNKSRAAFRSEVRYGLASIPLMIKWLYCLIKK